MSNDELTKAGCGLIGFGCVWMIATPIIFILIMILVGMFA